MNHFQVFISAETKEEATNILNILLKKKLILGGPILEGPAKFWWKGEIVEMNYFYILTYTMEKLKQQIIDEYEALSKEEVPMISFLPFEGNQKLIDLIEKTLK